MTKSPEKIAKEREAAEAEIAGIKAQLALLASGREELQAEFDDLNKSIPQLTQEAFDGKRSREAKTRLTDNNRRLREIESDLEAIARTEADLRLRLAELDSEQEQARIALLRLEDARLLEQSESLDESFRRGADELGAILKRISDIHGERINLSKQIGEAGPRWLEVTRGMRYQLGLRLGRRSGSRYHLDGFDDPTSAWIAANVKNGNGHKQEEL